MRYSGSSGCKSLFLPKVVAHNGSVRGVPEDAASEDGWLQHDLTASCQGLLWFPGTDFY